MSLMEPVNDWRARFLQTGSDDDLPIVDAHHHFFDLTHNYHPWLCDRPPISFRYGDYQSICQNFLPEDYFRVSAAHRVVKTVLMEGEWNPRDPMGEARWVAQLAQHSGFPQAMAAQAWLDRDDIDDVLAAYEHLPLVRSVRHKPAMVVRSEYRPRFAAAGSMRCSRWRDGYAKLAGRKLMFELQAHWWHFAEAAELLRDFPQTTIVVNHTGMPSDRSEEGLAGWCTAMELLAREPNVFLKISGICVPGQRWTPVLQGPVVRDAIRIFGVDRCMFASNFPVDGVLASFDDIYSGFKAITRDVEPAARLALFHDNAIRLYGL